MNVRTSGIGRFSSAVRQLGRRRDRRAVVEVAARVERHAVLAHAPLAGDVEVVEREADRIHEAMAGVARRFARCISMRSRVVSILPSFASAVSSSGGNVRRRRRRRRAEQHFHHPLAAQHRRRAVRERGLHQHAALAEQAAARVVRILHLAEVGARRRRGCRSAAPAARSRTCSRREESSTLRSSRTRLLKNSSVSRRIAAARLSSKFG